MGIAPAGVRPAVFFAGFGAVAGAGSGLLANSVAAEHLAAASTNISPQEDLDAPSPAVVTAFLAEPSPSSQNAEADAGPSLDQSARRYIPHMLMAGKRSSRSSGSGRSRATQETVARSDADKLDFDTDAAKKFLKTAIKFEETPAVFAARRKLHDLCGPRQAYRLFPNAPRPFKGIKASDIKKQSFWDRLMANPDGEAYARTYIVSKRDDDSGVQGAGEASIFFPRQFRLIRSQEIRALHRQLVDSQDDVNEIGFALTALTRLFLDHVFDEAEMKDAIGEIANSLLTNLAVTPLASKAVDTMWERLVGESSEYPWGQGRIDLVESTLVDVYLRHFNLTGQYAWGPPGADDPDGFMGVKGDYERLEDLRRKLLARDRPAEYAAVMYLINNWIGPLQPSDGIPAVTVPNVAQLDKRFDEAEALHDAGKHAEANAQYDAILTSDPEYYLAWYSKGEALRSLGRFEEAIMAYEKYQALCDSNLLGLERMVEMFGQLGRFEEARVVIRQIRAINPNYAPALGEDSELEDVLSRRRRN